MEHKGTLHLRFNEYSITNSNENQARHLLRFHRVISNAFLRLMNRLSNNHFIVSHLKFGSIITKFQIKANIFIDLVILETHFLNYNRMCWANNTPEYMLSFMY